MSGPARSCPARATALLAVALAAAGAVLARLTPAGGVIRAGSLAPAPVLFGCLLVAFAVAELALLHVELRREAYSFSLSGVPLVFGVLFLDPHWLILARLLGAVIAMAWQRPARLKAGYNLAAYLFEAGLIGFALHRFVATGAGLTLRTALICYGFVALTDLLMSSAVLLVISWHQGRVGRPQIWGSFLPAAGLGALCTGGGFGIGTLLLDGPLGVVLIVGFAGAGGLVYRGYLVLRRRHQSLTLINDFVAQGVGATTVRELAETLLGRTRRLLSAAEVQLRVVQDGAGQHLRVDEHDRLSVEIPSPATASDWLLTRVLANSEPIVIPRAVRERGMRQWLVDNQARDALIVPVETSKARGVLIVKDRLGETATFTADDLAMLQTLAGHMVVALRATELLEQLRAEATHDPLTGLANRARLCELIDAALQGTPDQAPGPAVLLLDLDKFKEVNDALGHHVGDSLLRIVGARLQACVPEQATVARLGGDEFVILLPSTTDPRRQARALAADVVAALSTPIALEEAVVSTRASIGIALTSEPGTTNADLLRHADIAMYAAKNGQDAFVVYTDELDRGRAQRLALLADLHLALDRDELELNYQPQLDLRTDEVVSVEALVRWRHPQLGLLGPDAFIPLAESSGLIQELSRQVLGKALRQCRAWREEGIDLSVAVNLSAFNVNHGNLADDVAAALRHAGVPASRLVLEITESSVMGDPRRTVPILKQLADLGIALSLDDFGTGYSSLSYLQRLPVNEVKIDKSFVTGMAGTDGAQASQVLVRSILTLGASLGLRVVAEGIEDLEVLELLRGLGCDLAQGYYIDRPLPAEAISARMRAAAAKRRPVRLSVLAG